jgi:hypothetical protein
LISFEDDQDLGLMAQAAVGRAVDDAVTVALEGRAVGVLGLRVATPARVGAAHGITGQRCCLLPLYLLAPDDHVWCPRMAMWPVLLPTDYGTRGFGGGRVTT